MTPIQQLYLGVGTSKKTYMDDVFSTYLYKGTAGSNTVNNGIDISGKGGLVWFKERGGGGPQQMFDTVRGTTKALRSSGTDAEETRSYGLAFNTNGYSLNSGDGNINSSSNTYASWTFRKSKGFFDIVTYTGNGGGARSINHNLGSIPGFVALKSNSNITNWVCYHKDFSSNQYVSLNSSAVAATDANQSINSVTSTQFTVGSDQNTNGLTFVVYLWAGGESTAATAKSVDFDGTGDYLNTTSSSSDFTMGTGDYTVECWVNWNNKASGIFQIADTSGGLASSSFSSTISAWIAADDTWKFTANDAEISTGVKAAYGQWTHVALVRASGVTKLYLNGDCIKSATDTYNYNGTYIGVGSYWNTSYVFKGKISNFRVVKGTAVYTSSFRPTTEPLTNITNTKLLCCNNSSVAGSTVTPVTLNSQGDPTASTDSPFDDPAAFTFGDSKEGIVKCGSYKGNGSATGPEINLGWEPQYLLIKRTSDVADWLLMDSMRGIVTASNEAEIYPNANSAESTANDRISLTGTGFKIVNTGNPINGVSDDYIYLAIRRPDPLVQKPVELGTDVFALDTGNSSSTIPAFDSNFAVDFAIMKQPAAVLDWRAFSRHTSGRSLATDHSGSETAEAGNTTDSNTGICYGYTDVWAAAMWKRHAGFDVVTYKGNGKTGPGSQVRHSLGVVPEMIWVKRRNANAQWMCYHKGLNGGTNPEQYAIALDDTAAEVDSTSVWNDTAPTAYDVTLYDHGNVNESGDDYLMMLFASVAGISKVGYYTGSGSTGFSVTTGFSPRYLIIRRTDVANEYWPVFDTLRGLASGNDPMLKLDSSAAHITGYDIIDPTSTGFDLITTDSAMNASNGKYIYYAHA